MTRRGVVVVGAGHAGFGVAEALRTGGYAEPITLVEHSHLLPYQRPPLSKGYLAGKTPADLLAFRPRTYYEQHDIVLLQGDPAAGIDAHRDSVLLTSGRELPCGHVVVATGSKPRRLGGVAADVRGVHYLHDLGSAAELRESMAEASNMVIIGGGFIGMEVASVAATSGCAVTVVETAGRVMERSLGPLTSAFMLDRHSSAGVDVRLRSAVREVVVSNRHVRAVALEDGSLLLPADLVLVGIGSTPRSSAFASLLGRLSDGAIAVDSRLRSSVPFVSAVGDVAAVEGPGGHRRLESVQTAAEQARRLAASLAGTPARQDAVPWFWTEQQGVKVQIAGVLDDADGWILRGDVSEGRFSVVGFRGGTLLGAESVAQSAEHVAFRELLAAGGRLNQEEAADPSFDLLSRAREQRGPSPVSRAQREQQAQPTPRGSLRSLASATGSLWQVARPPRIGALHERITETAVEPERKATS